MQGEPTQRIRHVIIKRTDVAEAYASAFAHGERVSDRTIIIKRTGLPPDTFIEAEVLAGPGLEACYVYRVAHPSFAEAPDAGRVPIWHWQGSPDIT